MLPEEIAKYYLSKGVYIITTEAERKINGMTASWVTQISVKPMLILMAIHKRSYTGDMLRKSGIFAVNVLSEAQKEEARLFGLRSGRQVNKFQNISYFKGKTGIPILAECLAYLEGEVTFSKELGDHTIFIGEVVNAEELKKGIPLLYNESLERDPNQGGEHGGNQDYRNL